MGILTGYGKYFVHRNTSGLKVCDLAATAAMKEALRTHVDRALAANCPQSVRNSITYKLTNLQLTMFTLYYVIL